MATPAIPPAVAEAWAGGRPVVLYKEENGAPVEHYHVALRQSGGMVFVSAPGANNWRPLGEQPARSNYCERRSYKLANMALAWLGDAQYTFDAETHGWLVSRACDACGRPLVSPEAILAGVGPECSGKYAAQQQRSAERRARVASLTPETMRALLAARK